jgi:transcriptional regulator with XRE-family HTH domain
MDVGNLSRLESGKMGYSKETIERIAKVLHVSVGVLFAEPGIVEAAALRMRAVPRLTPDQLLVWRTEEEIDLGDEQVFLHAALGAISSHSFALTVRDGANAPLIVPGDVLIFDAAKHPGPGSFVAAQAPDSTVYIGKFRGDAKPSRDLKFEVVPCDHFYPVVAAGNPEGLRLRGTLAERRTIFA